MAVMGLAGVLRGKKVRTTISRKAVAAGDRVNRQFVAVRPDQLWGGFYLRQHMAGLRLCGVYH
ncbi:putative transposase [Escherichia coli P0304777.5]|nr:putative transposase [Escherichia coli P0304777.5]